FIFLVEEENPDSTLMWPKNVMLFLGDGMGITTITAARILKVMTMDTFPHVGLVKVDTHAFQTVLATRATAYLCGVKTNLNVVGMMAAAKNGVCRTEKGNEVTSILQWRLKMKVSGISDQPRSVQHATPAGAYVIIGGGRKYMTPKGTADPEYPADASANGNRQDQRNLIEEWISQKKGKVELRQLLIIHPSYTVFFSPALFEPVDMRFEVERDPLMDPSIIETTEKAIRILQKNPKGFFLLVEGHHASRASMALHEAVALDNAVARALEMTKEDETLTVVTADHSHSLSFNGYPFRGNSILGKSPLFGLDMLPYTTLMYGNGPGHKITNNKRPDIRNVDTKSKDYVQQAAVPLDSETHGGEDVAVLARGPMAHLFQGVNEQSYLAHAMAYAACIGDNQQHCASTTPPTNNNAGRARSSAPISPLISALPVLLGALLSLLLY
uniref:alkaline phosphatase n=1 Tax=Astyanax mexicanus TaxID=7994 RepID=A0A3B1KBN4_ASTMX